MAAVAQPLPNTANAVTPSTWYQRLFGLGNYVLQKAIYGDSQDEVIKTRQVFARFSRLFQSTKGDFNALSMYLPMEDLYTLLTHTNDDKLKYKILDLMLYKARREAERDLKEYKDIENSIGVAKRWNAINNPQNNNNDNKFSSPKHKKMEQRRAAVEKNLELSENLFKKIAEVRQKFTQYGFGHIGAVRQTFNNLATTIAGGRQKIDTGILVKTAVIEPFVFGKPVDAIATGYLGGLNWSPQRQYASLDRVIKETVPTLRKNRRSRISSSNSSIRRSTKNSASSRLKKVNTKR